LSEEAGVLGIVVAHGELATGLVSAVTRIAGSEPDALVALSNEGRSPEELGDILEERIGGRVAVVFTDMQTGSCALVARLTCRERDDRAVIFGVNLAMLLDFVFHRHLPLEELVPRLLKKGRESVRAIPETLAHADPAVSG